MFKAILYYILYLAVFFITVLFGGFIYGLYVAIGTQKGYLNDQAAIIGGSSSSPFAVICVLLGTLLVWLTFRHYHFSKFSLGHVIPATKWKTMGLTTLPLLGFSLVSRALMSVFHIEYLPKELLDTNYAGMVFYGIVGAFISAYIDFGAIQEELIRSGKRLWVQYLVICLMILPSCAITASKTGNVSLQLTLLSIVSACYGCWLYGKTRSSIIIFVCYLFDSLVPDKFESTALSIAIIAIGIALLMYGTWALRKHLPLLLQTDESQQN